MVIYSLTAPGFSRRLAGMKQHFVKRLESLGVVVYDSSGDYHLHNEAKKLLVGVAFVACTILALYLFFDFLIPYLYGW